MRLDDRLLGLLLVGFSALVIGYAQTFPVLGGMDVGPALFPSVIASFLGVCGLAMIVQGALRRRAGERGPLLELDPWARTRRGIGSLVIVVGAVIFFGSTLEFLGFHISAALTLLVLLLWLEVRPVTAVLTAALATFVTHGLFYSQLRVPLPWGLLEPVAW
ncbi:MAG: tripartite tricarboxylate transporter TctB family protein [Pseudomonadota bacterium]